MEENSIKKIVTTLDSGIATPIPVSKNDATDIAQQQEQSLQKQREEQLKELEEQLAPKQSLPIENQALVEQFYQVNDLVQIVEQKNDPKLIAIMCLILLIIVIIIIIELPMLLKL